MATETQSIAIVHAIIALCKSLKIVVMAEGVKTEVQADILRLENCDYLQGFLLGKPTPKDDLASAFLGSLATAGSATETTASSGKVTSV